MAGQKDSEDGVDEETDRKQLILCILLIIAIILAAALTILIFALSQSAIFDPKSPPDQPLAPTAVIQSNQNVLIAWDMPETAEDE